MFVPRRKPGVAALAIALLTLHAAPAFAYLDPGTGSLLLQGLIGAIAVAVFTVRLYWYKLKSMFTSKKTPPEEKLED